MESGLYIIDAIIIAIVVLPFALFINGRHKRKRKLRKALEQVATRSNCKLSKIDTYSNFAIGWDAAQEKLLFYKETADSAYAKVVDLKVIMSCRIVKDAKRVKDKKTHYDVIEKLQLSFEPKNKKDIVSLELYNNDDEMVLSNELVVAQEWEAFLNKYLADKHQIIASENQKEMAAA